MAAAHQRPMALAARTFAACQQLRARLQWRTSTSRFPDPSPSGLPSTAWKRQAAASGAARPAAAAGVHTAAAGAAASAATAAEDVSAAAAAAAAEEPLAAYVHLPFCKKKCSYCDFPVIAVGMNLAQTDHVQDNMRRYVDLVLQEIEASQKLNRRPLQTIFFGGGTPSLISLPLLEQLLTALDRRFGIQAGAEISIEADPGTFDADRLRSYMGMGVTRVSVGVQSFQEELLQLCGRAHDVADVYRAIEAVHAAGVPTWSLDLMSGLPQLTEDLWHQSLQKALDAAPPHMSTYDLQVEDHTPFAKRYSPGEAPLPSDDSAAAMYCQASSVLGGAGFEHYEVSNYALPGHRCQHNMAYWESWSYYAFGLGSASYLQGRRFSRPKRLNAYKQWLKQFAADAERLGPQVGGSWLPRESNDDRLLDTIMLRLRLGDGLDLRQLAQQHAEGQEAADLVLGALRPHIERGWVLADGGGGASSSSSGSGSGGSIVDSSSSSGVGPGSSSGGSGDGGSSSSAGGSSSSGSEEARRVRLADPLGFVVSNDIISDVFAAFDVTEDE